KEFFDLARVDVLAAADDHVFEAAGDAVVAVGRLTSEIARVQPAVGGEGSGGLDRLVIVALHDTVSAAHELALLSRRHRLDRTRLDQLDLDAGKELADRADAMLDAIGSPGLRDDRAGLGESVADGHFASAHLVADGTH